jgi:hypothetical protein
VVEPVLNGRLDRPFIEHRARLVLALIEAFVEHRLGTYAQAGLATPPRAARVQPKRSAPLTNGVRDEY